MNRQDGPLLVGAVNENTPGLNQPLKINNNGELLVTTAGAGGVSDVNLDEVGGVNITLGQKAMAASLPVVIASDQTAVPVTTLGSTATVKYAVIAASSSGDNTLVAGVALKKIRVLVYMLSVSAAVNAKFQSSTAGDLTGLFYFAANSGATAGFSPNGHFETVAGEDLQLNLSGSIPVGGHLVYQEV